MSEYNYYENVTEDAKTYLRENIEYIREEIDSADDLEEYLNDTLWNADSVTGNGSGSYTCDTWEAEENIAHNWELLMDALAEFGFQGINPIEKGAEWCDVTIRCYLLNAAIAQALQEMEEEIKEAFEQ